MPETSIIIRSFNEEKYLPKLLDGISAQTYRDYEVVVVDSGSFDHSREIARQRGAVLVEIRPDDFTFGHSLNTGIDHGGGRFIVIVSAHTAPVDEWWLERLIEPLREERVAMVYGRQKARPESKFSERLDFERTFGPQRKVLSPPDFFANNANSAIRRDLFAQHRFDEKLPGLEDAEWAKYWMERGYCIVYEPSAAIYHIHTETWSQVRGRYYREGVAAKWIGTRSRRDLASVVWAEARSFLGDVAQAARERRLIEKGVEIARFRCQKLAGTVSGIWDGALMANPIERSKLLFDKEYDAVVIEGVGQASLKKVEMPPLKPGDVLIRVAYVGVCRTDLEILEGKLDYYKNGLAKYPIVPGHEFSGTVAGIGARVANVKEGDRVVAECIQGCNECPACRKKNWIGCADRRELGVIGMNGAYAQYVITPGRFVHVLPPSLGLREACLCEPAAVVLKGLRRLERGWGPAPGSRTCAVIGAGPIGHLAARILSRCDHRVTVFDRDDRRLAYFHGSGPGANQHLNGLAGFDSIVEASGDPDALETVLHHSAPGSSIALLGLPYARRDFNFERIVGYDKMVIGSVGSSAEDFAEAIATLPHLDLTAFLQQVLPLPAFAQAWESCRSHKHLKVILEVDSRS